MRLSTTDVSDDDPRRALSPFSMGFTVRHLEAGVIGRLTVGAFLDLFQELAGVHAARLGFSLDDLLPKNLAWVLLRLFVRFEGPMPALGEAFRFTTWPSGADGLYAWREAVAETADGRAFARLTTRWVMIDVARRRPTRLSDDFAAFARPDLGRLDLADAAPVAPAEAAHTAPLVVRRADLDANRHANNARYVDWALEPLPDAFLDAHDLASLDVAWKTEALRFDALDATAGPDPSAPDALAHAVVRPSDGRVTALVRTRWTPRA